MALVYYDRVKETTTTSGTGTYTLLGAATGFQSFSVVGNGNTCYYTATNGTDWEVGLGTWATGGTLARTSVLASSNSGSAVSWGGSSKDVFLTAPATIFGSLYADPLTTRGDILTRGASASQRVALGSAGQVLRSDGTDAIWGSRFPKGHMHGLRVRYSTVSAVIVEVGECRDRTDAYDLTLASEKTLSMATINAIEGLDEKTLTATATTHGTATMELTVSLYSETILTSTVKTLTGTFSSSGTALTGTNSKLKSEAGSGDLIRVGTKGAARIDYVTAEGAAVLIAAFPGGNASSEAGTLYENAIIRVAAETPQKVRTVTNDGITVVVGSSWTSNTSGVALKMGGELASAFYYPHVAAGGSGTSAFVSSQRTKPYGITGYDTATRMLGFFYNGSGGDISLFESWVAGRLAHFSCRDESILSNGVDTSYTWKTWDDVVPPLPSVRVAMRATSVYNAAGTNDQANYVQVSADGTNQTVAATSGIVDNGEHGNQSNLVFPITDFVGHGVYYKNTQASNAGAYLNILAVEFER